VGLRGGRALWCGVLDVIDVAVDAGAADGAAAWRFDRAARRLLRRRPNPAGRVVADFVTTVHVVGGTRQYARASGEIVAPGVLNVVTGATEGSYAAAICLSRGGAGST